MWIKILAHEYKIWLISINISSLMSRLVKLVNVIIRKRVKYFVYIKKLKSG